MVKKFFLTIIKQNLCLMIVAVATNAQAWNGCNGANMSGLHKSFQMEQQTSIVSNVDDDTKKKKATGKAADDMTLIVSGTGPTKEEATKSALRSALEQTFGTFVSSNTTILNDDLVKDEIVTVSSGTVKDYKYLAENEIDGNYFVTLEATVSIGKLVQYVQSKGSETELAGATFAMDVKMKRLRQENEEKAFKNLLMQLEEIVPTMFDYSIKVSSPKADGRAFVSNATITISTNQNYTNARNLILNTLNGLCVKSYQSVKDLHNKGIEIYEGELKNLRLPLTYVRKPVVRRKLSYANNRQEWVDDIEYEQRVFFLSEQFFIDLEKMISSTLSNTIIDMGKIQRHADISGLSHIGSIDIRPYTDDRSDRRKNCSFPVEKTATWQEEMRLSFSEEELEQISTIKVIPYNPKEAKTKEAAEVKAAEVKAAEAESFIEEFTLGDYIIDDDNRIYDVTEITAEFPGDIWKWLNVVIEYPAKCKEEGIQGRATVQFVIEKDGSLSDIKVVRSNNELLSIEAERVVKAMPKWKPAREGNKLVRMRYQLPIVFRLS